MCGSSPRVRGTVFFDFRHFNRLRFIPAGAGNRMRKRSPLKTTSVHPRGCGEQSLPLCKLNLIGGSSPRVRGTGTHTLLDLGLTRFIPAGAGNRFW